MLFVLVDHFLVWQYLKFIRMRILLALKQSVKSALELGANLDFNIVGCSPLYYVSDRNIKSLFMLLLKYKARITEFDRIRMLETERGRKYLEIINTTDVAVALLSPSYVPRLGLNPMDRNSIRELVIKMLGLEQ